MLDRTPGDVVRKIERIPARFRARTCQDRRSGVTVLLVPIDEDLVARVAASTGLTAAEAARVVEDVLAFHAEPVEDYVRRRHTQLKTHGMRNPEIFARISEELAHRVVAAPRLTERQLRRLIYT